MDNESQDALKLPRSKGGLPLKEFRAIRWLDTDGAVRMGRLIAGNGKLHTAFDELTHCVFMLAPSEYEDNVEKDANGNPVKP